MQNNKIKNIKPFWDNEYRVGLLNKKT